LNFPSVGWKELGSATRINFTTGLKAITVKGTTMSPIKVFLASTLCSLSLLLSPHAAMAAGAAKTPAKSAKKAPAKKAAPKGATLSTVSGSVSAEKGPKGKTTGLKITGDDGKSTPIVFDAKAKAMAKKVGAEHAELTGTIVAKKGKGKAAPTECFKVKSFKITPKPEETVPDEMAPAADDGEDDGEDDRE